MKPNYGNVAVDELFPECLQSAAMAARRHDDGRLHAWSHEFTDHRKLEGVVGFVLAVDRQLPRIVLRFAEVDGRMICANIEIGVDLDNPDELDPEPITTELLRRIPLAYLINQTLQKAVRSYEAASNWESFGPVARARLPAAKAAIEKPKRPGRPPEYGDDHYAEVAAVYRAHSGGHSPTKAVMEHFGVSKSAAAKWVAEARKRSLLEPYGGRPAAENRQSGKRRQTRRAT
jgi:hypothetical protein